MKKFTFYIMLFVLFIFVITGCTTEDETFLEIDKIKPVKTMEANEETYSITLDYLGLVDSGTTKKYSFKSAGKIEKIYVSKGEKIKKGDKLAQLNLEDLNYSVKAAKAQLDSAQAQYDNAIKGASEEKIKQAELNVTKAEEAYNYAKKNYEDFKTLYDDGLISEQDLEKAELEMNLRKADYEIAQQVEAEAKTGISEENKQILLSQVEQAKVNYDQKKNMLNNATIISDIDGYVVDVLNKEGELIDAGYPVIIVRNENTVVNVGLTQEDIDLIEVGQKAIVKANEKETEGTVSQIASIPDQQTRTYNVEIALKEELFRIGTIANVTIILREEQGILIPITSVLKNGESYVYVVEDEHAIKKNITIKNVKGSEIVVNGLNSGDIIVIEGAKDLSDGDKVIIKH